MVVMSLLRIILLSSLCLFGVNTSASTDNNSRFSVVVFAPSISKDDYWTNVFQFAKAVGSNLGIDITIVTDSNGNRLAFLNTIKVYLKGDNKPDAILFTPFRNTTVAILDLTEKYKIPAIIYNNRLPPKQRQLIGKPREKYDYYIGHVLTEDYELSKSLIRAMMGASKWSHDQAKLRLVGIGGYKQPVGTLERHNALIDTTKNLEKLTLLQLLYADWKAVPAKRKMTGLLNRHDQFDLVWCANDQMAFGVRQALNESGRDSIIGAFNWTEDALNAIESGDIDYLAGGHFMDAGFAIVLLYDYFQGLDFYDDNEGSIYINGAILDNSNIKVYKNFLLNQEWKNTDFKKLTKQHNEKGFSYDFSLIKLQQ